MLGLSKLGELLDRGLRTEKPRRNGITIVLDKGIGCNEIADLGETSADHFDYAKIAWASALITKNLEKKLKSYASFNITPLLGGTLFEYAYMRGGAERLLEVVKDTKLHV